MARHRTSAVQGPSQCHLHSVRVARSLRVQHRTGGCIHHLTLGNLGGLSYIAIGTAIATCNRFPCVRRDASC